MKEPAIADTSPKSSPAAGVANVASSQIAPDKSLSRRQWRQLGLISLAAIGVFAFMRWLPTGTNLSHMDFRVDTPNAIEFCDPSNPQFIPVVAVASPVSLTVNASPTRAGERVQATAMLRTASGKAIAAEDLLVVHTRKLHLLIADPALADYQHVHPEPTRTPGEWSFAFTPRAAGTYRVFADFTPAATNRGLYAHADMEVRPVVSGESGSAGAAGIDAATTSAADVSVGSVDREGFRFTLTPATVPIRAGRPADLKFTVTRLGGGEVPLRPVMDAFAHLVAFDQSRSGFAHLHPAQLDLARPPDTQHPALDFKITIPKPGRYVIWAQVDLEGRDTFVAFWFDVAE